MGDSSRAMPSINLMTTIKSLPSVSHQPEFATHCVPLEAGKPLRGGALVMAWTCIGSATKHDFREGLMAHRRQSPLPSNVVPGRFSRLLPCSRVEGKP